MRAFIAIDIEPALTAQLTLAREAMSTVLNEAPVPPRITWVKEQSAHVTVRFLGDVADGVIEQIRAALAALEVRPFTVTWGTPGVFGGTRNPRVIWIAPTSGKERVAALSAQVNALLDPVVGPGESRRFSAHLTLGRVKEGGRGVEWARALRAITIGPTTSAVTGVTLYQSRLSPKGPTYTALSTHG